MSPTEKFWCTVCKKLLDHRFFWKDGQEYAQCPRCGNKTVRTFVAEKK